MKFITKILRFVYSVYGFAMFLTIMIILFPIIVIASFFGKMKGGNIIYKLCIVWADVWFLLLGIYHTNIYDYPHDTTQQYIFLSNHISYLDIPMILKSVRKHHIRILAKSEMTKIPVFGYIYKSAVVQVDRNDPAKRAKSVMVLKSVIKKGVSVFICPEGTFNTTPQPLKEFYSGAFRIAIETQTPIKPVLFLDTYDRLNYKSIFSLNPGRCRTVFLSETKTEGLTLNDMSSLKEKVYNEMEAALIKYKASWITATKEI